MEATMWGGATTRSELQQSISLLHELNEVPEMPTENPIDAKIDLSHRLSLLREKEITSNLAFLSATSEDKSDAMGVCIEEHSTGEGITVRIASNSRDLLAVTAGLERVGKILEQAAKRENTKTEDIKTLFQHVVVLDMDRILLRLRSRHARNKKQAFITQLYDAINDKSVKSTRSLTNGVTDLQTLFAKLERISDIKAEIADAHNLIRDIITQAYVLISPNDLRLLLKGSAIEPSLEAHLYNTLGKLRRYYSAASYLVCAARDKKWRVFHTILIEPFRIEMPPTLIKDHIKVHAEIKLLFFYELHADLPRPRIICSSKSACYLCNLFFSLHGIFHIPRSHGRLYDKWTLPDWLPIPASRRSEFGDLATQLDSALKVRVRKGFIKHVYPTESVASIPQSWPPSTISKESSSLSSTSTIRPRSPHASPQLQGNPLTPPHTPPSRVPSRNSPSLPLATAEPVQNTPSTQHITLTLPQLPYYELITAITPPLYLHLDNPRLTLYFDFSHASPCRLTITRGDDRVGEGEEYRIVDIEDIPTATEMRVARSEGDQRELKFQLRGGGTGGVCVAVVWGGL